MLDPDRVLELARAATVCLERNRRRLDDLNVYPVPDGDTGTNLTLTARAVVDALEGDGAAPAETAARAALLGARGNSGVILSQIVRGAADVLGSAEKMDAATIAAALRAASDAAYRAVREPVEGTMLTAIRALAEEAEAMAARGASLEEVLAALVRRGEEAVARTQEQLAVLREAGVVDAGAAGLVELVRGIAAAVRGEALPEPEPSKPLAPEAIHLETSPYRYCTVFLVEGEALDRDGLEADLAPLGDSLLVVGDGRALKVHVHTDDPGAAMRLGTACGVVEGVEIANMHRQAAEREARLEAGGGAAPAAGTNVSDVVAVASGAGNRRLFESLGAAAVVDGGATMNPATAEILDAVEAAAAGEVLVLPNNSNAILSAEQAAGLASKRTVVVPSMSIQAGLAALVAYDGSRSSDENEPEMREAVESVATGAVTVASRDVSRDGLKVSTGEYLGLLDGEPVAGGRSLDDVAAAVVDALLAEPRDVLTLLTGEDEPPLEDLLELIAERHPDVELDVQAGGQQHYPLLLSAE